MIPPSERLFRNEKLVFLDIETTFGKSIGDSTPLEIALVVAKWQDGRLVTDEVYHSFINWGGKKGPGLDPKEYAMGRPGYAKFDPEDIKKGADPQDPNDPIHNKIRDLLNKGVFVAHNAARFDLPVLQKMFPNIPQISQVEFIDTALIPGRQLGPPVTEPQTFLQPRMISQENLARNLQISEETIRARTESLWGRPEIAGKVPVKYQAAHNALYDVGTMMNALEAMSRHPDWNKNVTMDELNMQALQRVNVGSLRDQNEALTNRMHIDETPVGSPMASIPEGIRRYEEGVGYQPFPFGGNLYEGYTSTGDEIPQWVRPFQANLNKNNIDTVFSRRQGWGADQVMLTAAMHSAPGQEITVKLERLPNGTVQVEGGVLGHAHMAITPAQGKILQVAPEDDLVGRIERSLAAPGFSEKALREDPIQLSSRRMHQDRFAPQNQAQLALLGMSGVLETGEHRISSIDLYSEQNPLDITPGYMMKKKNLLSYPGSERLTSGPAQQANAREVFHATALKAVPGFVASEEWAGSTPGAGQAISGVAPDKIAKSLKQLTRTPTAVAFGLAAQELTEPSPYGYSEIVQELTLDLDPQYDLPTPASVAGYTETSMPVAARSSVRMAGTPIGEEGYVMRMGMMFGTPFQQAGEMLGTIPMAPYKSRERTFPISRSEWMRLRERDFLKKPGARIGRNEKMSLVALLPGEVDGVAYPGRQLSVKNTTDETLVLHAIIPHEDNGRYFVTAQLASVGADQGALSMTAFGVKGFIGQTSMKRAQDLLGMGPDQTPKHGMPHVLYHSQDVKNPRALIHSIMGAMSPATIKELTGIEPDLATGDVEWNFNNNPKFNEAAAIIMKKFVAEEKISMQKYRDSVPARQLGYIAQPGQLEKFATGAITDLGEVWEPNITAVYEDPEKPGFYIVEGEYPMMNTHQVAQLQRVYTFPSKAPRLSLEHLGQIAMFRPELAEYFHQGGWERRVAYGAGIRAGLARAGKGRYDDASLGGTIESAIIPAGQMVEAVKATAVQGYNMVSGGQPFGTALSKLQALVDHGGIQKNSLIEVILPGQRADYLPSPDNILAMTARSDLDMDISNLSKYYLDVFENLPAGLENPDGPEGRILQDGLSKLRGIMRDWRKSSQVTQELLQTAPGMATWAPATASMKMTNYFGEGGVVMIADNRLLEMVKQRFPDVTMGDLEGIKQTLRGEFSVMTVRYPIASPAGQTAQVGKFMTQEDYEALHGMGTGEGRNSIAVDDATWQSQSGDFDPDHGNWFILLDKDKETGEWIVPDLDQEVMETGALRGGVPVDAVARYAWTLSKRDAEAVRTAEKQYIPLFTSLGMDVEEARISARVFAKVKGSETAALLETKEDLLELGTGEGKFGDIDKEGKLVVENVVRMILGSVTEENPLGQADQPGGMRGWDVTPRDVRASFAGFAKAKAMMGIEYNLLFRDFGQQMMGMLGTGGKPLDSIIMEAFASIQDPYQTVLDLGTASMSLMEITSIARGLNVVPGVNKEGKITQAGGFRMLAGEYGGGFAAKTGPYALSNRLARNLARAPELKNPAMLAVMIGRSSEEIKDSYIFLSTHDDMAAREEHISKVLHAPGYWSDLRSTLAITTMEKAYGRAPPRVEQVARTVAMKQHGAKPGVEIPPELEEKIRESEKRLLAGDLGHPLRDKRGAELVRRGALRQELGGLLGRGVEDGPHRGILGRLDALLNMGGAGMINPTTYKHLQNFRMDLIAGAPVSFLDNSLRSSYNTDIHPEPATGTAVSLAADWSGGPDMEHMLVEIDREELSVVNALRGKHATEARAIAQQLHGNTVGLPRSASGKRNLAKGGIASDPPPKLPHQMTREEFETKMPNVEGYLMHGSATKGIETLKTSYGFKGLQQGSGVFAGSRKTATEYGSPGKGLYYVRNNPEKVMDWDEPMDKALWEKINKKVIGAQEEAGTSSSYWKSGADLQDLEKSWEAEKQRVPEQDIPIRKRGVHKGRKLYKFGSGPTHGEAWAHILQRSGDEKLTSDVMMKALVDEGYDATVYSFDDAWNKESRRSYRQPGSNLMTVFLADKDVVPPAEVWNKAVQKASDEGMAPPPKLPHQMTREEFETKMPNVEGYL
ncbi:MAG: hypothetical protein QF737_05125, partial [Dehalococcoidales bacterium]|nr:hypothetical protein [Dehalococcoidales bacterium]